MIVSLPKRLNSNIMLIPSSNCTLVTFQAQI